MISLQLRAKVSNGSSIKRASSICAMDNLRKNSDGAELNARYMLLPNLAITLSDQFDKETQIVRGRKILSEIGIKSEDAFLCFQCKPYPGFSEEEIVSELKRYRREPKVRWCFCQSAIVTAMLSSCKVLAQRSGGSLKYASVNSIADIMSVIMASDLFIGTSLHGNITAASHGIRHLFGPLPVDKAAGLPRCHEIAT